MRGPARRPVGSGGQPRQNPLSGERGESAESLPQLLHLHQGAHSMRGQLQKKSSTTFKQIGTVQTDGDNRYVQMDNIYVQTGKCAFKQKTDKPKQITYT